MKTPWHLWVIGVLSLLWNIGGAYDYVMTKTNNSEYRSAVPQDRLAMVLEAPTWFNVSWPVGVWFSVIGSLLLLMRSRFAPGAFALSLIGLIVSSIYTYGVMGVDNLAAAGTAAVVFSIAIPLVLIGLWIYARAMLRKGVLR